MAAPSARATRLALTVPRQPDDSSCGPTCLHAVYNYYGDPVPIKQLMAEVPALDSGGTLASLLAGHALRRGYAATIYTYNLQLFDPTWFSVPNVDIAEKLRQQVKHKRGSRMKQATDAYIDFLDQGGKLRLEELRPSLVRRFLKKGLPILTGLSATYLYDSAREATVGEKTDYDDVRGQPMGHFVVLAGYDPKTRNVNVADPLHDNPKYAAGEYAVSIERVLGAILLGVLTHDANLLILTPRSR